MVRRVIKMMYKEVRGLHQAAYILALFAFGSQILALARDRMLAHQFGAGAELDMYYAAFKIPDLLYVLFASTLSVYVLIPFIVSRIHGDDTSQAKALLGQVFSLFLILYISLAVIVYIAAPYIVPVLFPGMSSNTPEVVSLLRVLLLQPLLLGISSLFGVITQIGHRFVLYAISPLIYNVGIIIGIMFLYPVFGLQGLAYGVVFGAAGHMLVQLPLVQRSSLSFWFTCTFQWKILLSVLKVSVPRALTLAMHQIVLLILVAIAGMMATGSVSVFQFAYNLQSVPLAIIGASYSIAAFPLLADLYTRNEMQKFRLHITTALQHIIFWSIPVIGLLIVLRAQVVRVVLGSGAFDWGDTRLTAAVLAVLGISLFAQAINLLMVRVFYAGGYTKIPFFVTLLGSITAVILTFVSYKGYISSTGVQDMITSLMRINEVPGSEILTVAFGYSVAIILQTMTLTALAVHKFKLVTDWVIVRVCRAVFSAIIGGFCAYISLHFFIGGINEDTFIGIFLQGLMGGVAGIIGVITSYYVTQSPELKEIHKSLQARVTKTRIIASQDEVL